MNNNHSMTRHIKAKTLHERKKIQEAMELEIFTIGKKQCKLIDIIK